MILRWLRIPPGTSLRKNYGPSTSSGNESVLQNEYIDAMVGITVDDICIGEEPLSINYREGTPDDIALKLKEIVKEFNSIVRWVATDLCIEGYSVYDVKVSSKNRLLLFPYNEPVDFYLTSDKKVVCFEQGNLKKNLNNKLIFINFDKRSLVAVSDKNVSSKLKFQITPTPMQLTNATKTLSGLSNAEDSIAKYRAQLGRIARWANVDIGTTQGDQQDDVVNSISEAINANSSSLAAGTAYTEFDDNIPVLPNRRGLGKVDLVTDIPNVNIKELADIDYWLSKLNLLMRFPATYMDFSKSLDSTAVSLVRGDIRYKKLCKKVSTKITTTINDYLGESNFSEYEPVVSLINLPSSEDDDVVSALDDYVKLTDEVSEFIMGSEGSEDLTPLDRLELLQTLLAPVTNSPALQDWFEIFREKIKQVQNKGIDEEEPSEETDFNTEEDFGSDFEDFSSESDFTDISEPAPEEPIEETSDFEYIEPQTGGI